MIDDKIARVKELIRKREEIDAELNALFGGAEPTRRGRPRKDRNSGDAAGIHDTNGEPPPAG
jgi:hypothetical protein